MGPVNLVSFPRLTKSPSGNDFSTQARHAVWGRDYGYVLDSGRIALHGPSRELLEKAAVRDAYMGM